MALTYDRPVNDTIAAIATAMSPAGIGIIRISGPGAPRIASAVFETIHREKIDPDRWEPGRIRYGYIVRGGEILDEVMVSYFRAPHSYTTEDTIEINTHGGMLLMQQILDLVLEKGARMAEPGEFTKRAFLGGRIDLAKAEAVMDLISASSDFARRSSIEQLSGKVSAEVKKLRETILYETAFIESALDDPDSYDLEDYPPHLEEVCARIEERLTSLLSYAEEGKILKEGIRTVIVGKPNAGKSSLLNTLAGEERAIVTDVAGTTRDTLSETVRVGGVLLQLTDTAGIRDTEDRVEQIGVLRARKALQDADLILFMIDGAGDLSEEDLSIAEMVSSRIGEGSHCIVLLNKSDLEQKTEKQAIINLFTEIYKQNNVYKQRELPETVYCSLLSGEGLEDLSKVIRELFHTGRIEEKNEIFLSSARHREAVREAREAIRLVRASIRDGMSEEFFTIDLLSAYTSLGKILGEAVEDDLVEEIFSKFCMGK